MNKGFTLVEMLVVIGIIAILTAASLAGFSNMTKSAERAKAQELVSNTATALEVLYQKEGAWPKRIVSAASSGDGELDANTAIALKNYMSLNVSNGELAGHDRFGIFDSWGAAVIKARGRSTSLSDRVQAGGTVQDHILHFAIDLDDDGFVEASVGGESQTIRGTVVVWGAGQDGKMGTKDDLSSWSKGRKAKK